MVNWDDGALDYAGRDVWSHFVLFSIVSIVVPIYKFCCLREVCNALLL